MMPAKKSSQGKDQQSAAAKPQQQQQVDVQAMLQQDGASDFSVVALSIVDKKVRNLEKRKARLVTLKEKLSAGEQLEREQKEAINKLESVEEQLEMVKEMQKQLNTVSIEFSKQRKRQQKQEKAQQREQQREAEKFAVSETLRLQLLLNSMDETAKSDFQSGNNGAVQLNDVELEQLDDWYQLINPSRGESDNFEQDLQEASEHVLLYLEHSTKPVNETTYADLHKLVTRVDECGYFDESREQGGSDDEIASAGDEAAKEEEYDEEITPEEDYQAYMQPHSIGLESNPVENPQPTASVSTHVPPVVQPGVMVSEVHQYIPSTPSPTFPGLQATVLQVTGDENFPIDFLHDSDLRDADHDAQHAPSSTTQPLHSYSTVMNPTPTGPDISPIVSPTGEVIQPKPVSYKQQAASNGLGGGSYSSHVSGGAGRNHSTSNTNNNGSYYRSGGSGKPRSSGQMLGAPVIASGHYQSDYRQSGNTGLSRGRGGYRSSTGMSKKE